MVVIHFTQIEYTHTYNLNLLCKHGRVQRQQQHQSRNNNYVEHHRVTHVVLAEIQRIASNPGMFWYNFVLNCPILYFSHPTNAVGE